MRSLRYWVVAFILMQMGCTGLRVPKTNIDRTRGSFETDLSQLRDYLGNMPVDVVVTGYTPKIDSTSNVKVLTDANEVSLQDVVITQLDPQNTLVRPKGSRPTESIRIPTQYVTRISAFGMRTTTEPETKWSYWFAIGLAVMSLGFFLYDYNRNLGIGCEGGCQALAIVAGGAALIAALTVFLVNSISDTGAERKEVVAKTFWIK